VLPTLNFYANHALDFETNDYAALEYYAISELRKLAIPDDILLMEYDSLLLQFPGGDISPFTKIADWSPISFPGFPDKRKLTGKHIVSIGPMAMRIVFTPEHLILPSTIYERIEWYSPHNKEQVQSWRSFFYLIINHFGGDHALYVDEKITNKHYDIHHTPANTALAAFEQTLISHYGPSKKTLFDYPHGKYPKYYIDAFTDIKQQQLIN
jgi:hypothetical protein